MKIIALTSANEPAMSAACKQLLAAATHHRLQLSVLLGVKTALEAQAVYADSGELWRIGVDDSKPELDTLIDRAVDDSSPERMAREVDQALQRFLNKTVVAA